MEALPLAFATGWASGINAYLVVLVLGLADRFGSFDAVPDALGRWDVLAVAAVLYAMEFVADKIPYLDSTWDAVSTFIRPTAGAVVGALLAGQVSPHQSLPQVTLAAVGGGTALVSHLTKAGLRLAVNVSPEPVSNIAASLSEDLAVLTVVVFAVHHPRPAAAVAAVLLALGLVLLAVAARLVRRGWRRWRARPTATLGPTP